MKVYLHGDLADEMVSRCAALLAELGHERTSVLAVADVAVAPLLRRKLPPEELAAPRLGTLIFHPSILPRHRGPDAVRWAVSAGETYTGVSWFWADAGLDTGPVCEQDVVAIAAGEPPGQLYRTKMIPAGLRCLRRLLTDLAGGHRRAVPQNDDAATYESWLTPRVPAR